MEPTKPEDYLPLETYYAQIGHHTFKSSKLLSYHTKPIQAELIEAGAMARVGNRIFLHKTRFWPEYQRILAGESAKGDHPTHVHGGITNAAPISPAA